MLRIILWVYADRKPFHALPGFIDSRRIRKENQMMKSRTTECITRSC